MWACCFGSLRDRINFVCLHIGVEWVLPRLIPYSWDLFIAFIWLGFGKVLRLRKPLWAKSAVRHGSSPVAPRQLPVTRRRNWKWSLKPDTLSIEWLLNLCHKKYSFLLLGNSLGKIFVLGISKMDFWVLGRLLNWNQGWVYCSGSRKMTREVLKVSVLEWRESTSS